MKDYGWYSAQMPNFSKAPLPVQSEFVEPAIKAIKADELRAEVEAFIAAGGDFERIPSPEAWARTYLCGDREA
ncbi:hypothetical protein ACI2IY_12860 [Lysobacter enzymogenes]|uniref:hypothetical protein n=1 Tax=Lysobacter enzymogenes TaxID=69 RepID=UPI0038510DF6